MAIEINWSLLQPVDIGGQFTQGFERGKQQARERAVEGALSDLMPAMVSGAAVDQERKAHALGALAMYAPDRFAAYSKFEAAKREEAIAQAEAERRRSILGQYGTDPAAARTAALSAADTETLKVIDQLDDTKREQIAAGARLLEQTNPTDQPSYENALQLAKQAGIDVSTAPPQYSPQWVAGIKHLGRALNTAKPTEAPSSVREYEYAKGQGYTGTFQQWQQENAGPVVVTNEDGTKTIIPRSMIGGAGGPAPAATGGTTGGNASGIIEKNNPGALRKPGSMEFQAFKTPQEGVAAQEALLGRYHGRGLDTVAKVVETYAPRASRGGDNTDEQVNNYISYVAGRLGVAPGDPIPASVVPKLAEAMREFETGNRKPMGGSGPRRVSSKAEYDKLPSGTKYVAPDGSVRTKS